MKTVLRIGAIWLALVAAASAFAQNPPPVQSNVWTQQLTLMPQNPVASVAMVQFQPSQGGTSTLYYWFVSHDAGGNVSAPAGPFLSNFTSTPSVAYPAKITFTFPVGVVSVDILRESSPTTPTGACGCVVATGVAIGTFSDTVAATAPYTVSTSASQASQSFTVNAPPSAAPDLSAGLFYVAATCSGDIPCSDLNLGTSPGNAKATPQAALAAGKMVVILPGALSLASQVTVHGGQTLFLPSSGSMTWTGISDGTSCGIDVEGGGSLYSFGSANGSSGGDGKYQLETSGVVAMRGLLCANISGVSNYLHVEARVLLAPQNGASFTKGVLDIEQLFDASVIRDVSASLTADSVSNQIVGFFNGMCCGATVERVVLDAANQSGAIPANITGVASEGSADVNFIADSFDHPGAGKNAILLDSAGGAFVEDVNFFGQYIEGNSTDTTTALVQVGSANSASANFYGGQFVFEAPGSTAYGIDSCAGCTLHVSGLHVGGNSNFHAINDHSNGTTVRTTGSSFLSMVDYSNVSLFASGTVTLSSGAGSHTFARQYLTAPVCTATDTTAAAAVKVTATTTAVSLTGTGTDVVAWNCAPASN